MPTVTLLVIAMERKVKAKPMQVCNRARRRVRVTGLEFGLGLLVSGDGVCVRVRVTF